MSSQIKKQCRSYRQHQTEQRQRSSWSSRLSMHGNARGEGLQWMT
uniref:Uncharacterized protein n=1 Tax=Rhizophora mucronata TaxID=61149 RepID=A0A2P2P1X5_RHIMU